MTETGKNQTIFSEDGMTIHLPVPMGSPVYQPSTSCNDACLAYDEKFRKEFPDADCNKDCPGHVKNPYIQKAVLDFRNLGYVLENWMTRYFPTEETAREYAEETIRKHREQLEKHGIPAE